MWRIYRGFQMQRALRKNFVWGWTSLPEEMLGILRTLLRSGEAAARLWPPGQHGMSSGSSNDEMQGPEGDDYP